MNGNKREFYCLEENLKNSWIFINSRKLPHTEWRIAKISRSMKKLSCCTKTPNEDWHKQKNLLIGMQDLTPNKLFGCTATSSNTREKPRNKKSKKKKVLNLKKLLQSVHKMGDVTAGTDWQAPIGVPALWDAKLWLINTLATPSMLALLELVLVVNKVWGRYWLVLFLAKLLFFTTIASELAVS